MDGTPELEINLDDILGILGNAKRPLVEGEALLLADAVLLCGYSEKYKNSVKISSFVNPTSTIHEKLYEVNVQLSVDNNIKKICSKCSCPGGLGTKCKHIFATLLYVNRKRVSSIQPISCTDVRQKWGKIKQKLNLPYSCKNSIDKYCHFNKQKAHVKYNVVSDELKNLFFNKFTACVPNSEAAVHIAKKRKTKEYFETTDYSEEYILQLSLAHSLLDRVHLNFIHQPDVNYHSDFYKGHVEISHTDSVNLFMKTLCQNNDVWKNARMLKITGNVCYEIYTYSSNKNPDWMKKVNNVFYSQFTGNASTRHGILNENIAIRVYENDFKIKVEKAGFLVHPTCPWLGYSADGIAWSIRTLIEVKCPTDGKKLTALTLLEHLPFISISSNDIIFKENHKYYAQVQLGMMLLGLSKCHFIVYASFDKSICVIELLYNEKYTQNMVNTLKKTYFNNILPVIENKNATN